MKQSNYFKPRQQYPNQHPNHHHNHNNRNRTPDPSPELWSIAFTAALQAVMTASCRVLVRSFNWQPADGYNDLSRFTNDLIDEVTTNFDSPTITDFSKETYDECGVLIKIND